MANKRLYQLGDSATDRTALANQFLITDMDGFSEAQRLPADVYFQDLELFDTTLKISQGNQIVLTKFLQYGFGTPIYGQILSGNQISFFNNIFCLSDDFEKMLKLNKGVYNFNLSGYMDGQYYIFLLEAGALHLSNHLNGSDISGTKKRRIGAIKIKNQNFIENSLIFSYYDNWAGGLVKILKKYPQGQNGGNAQAGWNKLDLTDVKINNIPKFEVDLTNNLLIIPEGLYFVNLETEIYNIHAKLTLLDGNNNQIITSMSIDATDWTVTQGLITNGLVWLDGEYKIAVYSDTNRTNGLGVADNFAGQDEVYGVFIFQKLA